MYTLPERSTAAAAGVIECAATAKSVHLGGQRDGSSRGRGLVRTHWAFR